VLAFPSSIAVTSGSLQSGTSASLVAVDGDVVSVRASSSWSSAAFYGGFTAVPRTITSLKVSYTGRSNLTGTTLTLSAYNWSTGSWVSITSLTIGTGNTNVTNVSLPGTLSSYVSSSGQLRIRVRCTAGYSSTRLTPSTDVLSILYS
jgi:hypothetical protein